MKASLIYIIGAISATALPTTDINATACLSPQKRVEWRELSTNNQQSYINAVKCLKTKPSRIGLKDSTLYDDFPYVHFHLADFIHGSAPFLPWHRYFTIVYLEALAQCGYTGPGTYWDWSQDADGLRFSPVMSADHGFGGDGSRTRTGANPDPNSSRPLYCVSDGPFANLRPYYLATSPDNLTTGGHCLYRLLPEVSEPDAFAIMRENSIKPASVAKVQEGSGNWTVYHTALESGPHGAIHASLGGEMNPTTSPNEPLFFLHHAQIDRLWWLWQQKDLSTRGAEYSGEAAHFGETGRREVSLDDVLLMGGIAPDITVREVIDVSKSLCYTY
ncbi:tyrosinase [Microdochium nivale]|nr:tyrosinase [Microdochium nivale]